MSAFYHENPDAAVIKQLNFIRGMNYSSKKSSYLVTEKLASSHQIYNQRHNCDHSNDREKPSQNTKAETKYKA